MKKNVDSKAENKHEAEILFLRHLSDPEVIKTPPLGMVFFKTDHGGWQLGVYGPSNILKKAVPGAVDYLDKGPNTVAIILREEEVKDFDYIAISKIKEMRKIIDGMIDERLAEFTAALLLP
jgi:hypothetical protein